MCCLLHPSKSLELNDELFEEGKRRLYDFLKQEVVEGLCCLMTSSKLDEEEAQAPKPKNTSPQSTKDNILFLLFIYIFFNSLMFVCLFLIQSIRRSSNEGDLLTFHVQTCIAIQIL